MWWLWGFLGALAYGHAALIFALWNDGQTRSGRYKALAEFVGGLGTGAIFAQGWTPTATSFVEHWVKADRVAVALTIGWGSNYLWPRILRWLGRKVDKAGMTDGGSK